MSKTHILIGAHTSIAGGIQNAIYEGRDIGATTVQLFTANQRQWHSKMITDDEVLHFKRALKETGLSHIMSHAAYLINLGSPREDVAERSRQLFRDEVTRCLKLGISYLNFHPGAHLTYTTEECLDQVVKALLGMRDLFTGKDKLKLVVEMTAGQGTVVGSTFEEINYIIQRTRDVLPVGVCIDTCHVFTAGYDIRNAVALQKTLDEFDSVIGMKYLEAWHLNDSKYGLNSHHDRHEQLGGGEIGLDCFRAIMQHPKLRAQPKYLETPNGPDFWKNEIELLKSFVE